MDEEASTEAAAPSASLLELPTPTFDKCYLYLKDWTGYSEILSAINGTDI